MKFHLRNILSAILMIRRRLKTSYLLESAVPMNTSTLRTMVDNLKDINICFETAKKLTLEAGKLIRSFYNTEKLVESKNDIDQDLVTEYDKKVEKMLFQGLSKEFPNHKFIGEETCQEQKEIPELTDDPTWIIDPIDGTTNFVHAYHESCISVGLTICKEPVIGIIYNPYNCHLYTAKKNEGAFFNDVQIKTSSVTELKKALVSTELGMLHERIKNRDLHAERIKALIKISHGIRCTGSAALSLSYVARGILDIYQMQGLKPWDVAAAIVILKEAGGIVTDTKGNPFNVMQAGNGIIAASSDQLAKEVTKLIIDTDLQTQRKRLKRT